MFKNRAFTIIAVFLVLFVRTSLADELEINSDRCQSSADLDVKIDACTWLLGSGHLTKEGFANVRYFLGGAYLDQGQYDRAIQEYDKVIKIAPDSDGAYNNRGILLINPC